MATKSFVRRLQDFFNRLFGKKRGRSMRELRNAHWQDLSLCDILALPCKKVSKGLNAEVRMVKSPNWTIVVKLPVLEGPSLGREAKLLSKAQSCQRIVSALAVATASGSPADPLVSAIILEHCDGGSLVDYLRYMRLEPAEQRQVALDIAHGLYELHGLGHCHNHLTPHTIYLTGGPYLRAKIGGLGLATRAGQKSRFVGTPLWASPEMCRSHISSPAGDVYALGLVILSLCTSRPPFADISPVRHWRSSVAEIGEGKLRPGLPNVSEQPFVHPACAKVIESCLEFSEKDRPTVAEVITLLKVY